jgi:hypothetical protein
MKNYSNRSLAAVTITALLLSILTLPVMSGSAGTTTTAPKGASSITASAEEPFAAYTRKRTKKRIVRRKRVVRRRKVARRKRVVKRVVRRTAPVAPLAVVAAPAVTAAPVNDPALAQTILDGYKAQYPRYLGSATVEFGNAMGYQAVSYYTIGRIVISPTHSASVQVIVAHEIWHIIDWQDNNAIDWGESIPPVNYATYAN